MVSSRTAHADASGRSAAKGDWISLPPDREAFASVDGRHRLTIRSIDEQGWSSRQSRAEMQQLVGNRWQEQWRLQLPHHYRPRFAITANRGVAVLLDEWINIRSPLAIMVIGGDGKVLATSTTDSVLQTLGVPANIVITSAKFGFWLQSKPALTADHQHVEVQTAGKVLRIRLEDGLLSVS